MLDVPLQHPLQHNQTEMLRKQKKPAAKKCSRGCLARSGQPFFIPAPEEEGYRFRNSIQASFLELQQVFVRAPLSLPLHKTVAFLSLKQPADKRPFTLPVSLVLGIVRYGQISNLPLVHPNYRGKPISKHATVGWSIRKHRCRSLVCLKHPSHRCCRYLST